MGLLHRVGSGLEPWYTTPGLAYEDADHGGHVRGSALLLCTIWGKLDPCLDLVGRIPSLQEACGLKIKIKVKLLEGYSIDSINNPT